MDLSDVERVSTECDCSTQRAKALLAVNDGDPEKTIAFYRSMNEMKKPKPLVPPRPKRLRSPDDEQENQDNADRFQENRHQNKENETQENEGPNHGNEQDINDNGQQNGDSFGDEEKESELKNGNNESFNDSHLHNKDGQHMEDSATKPNNQNQDAQDSDETSSGNSSGNGSQSHGGEGDNSGIIGNDSDRSISANGESKGADDFYGLPTPPPEDLPNEKVVKDGSISHAGLLEQHLSDDESSSALEGHELLKGQDIPEEDTEWDLTLPKLEVLDGLTPVGKDGQTTFSTRQLVGAIQNGAKVNDVRAYLQYYEPKVVKRMISEEVEGIPAIFYAVGSNDEWIIREFADKGADINAVCRKSDVPLIAFAVFNSQTIDADTNTCVATLLSLGASPMNIPTAFYTPFGTDLPNDGPDEEDLGDIDSPKLAWCKSETLRRRLAQNLNLTQRYHLHRATRIKKTTIRERQVAKLRRSTPLLGLPYFLIGQTAASAMVRHQLLSYMTRDIIKSSRRPLVMVFAGPSGHGKTELARRLGHLLDLEMEVIDCTSCQKEAEFFGPKFPYNGAERGSPLNNFLARKSGQKSIVFLDEFEKTSPEVHNALLIPFAEGRHEDRRNRSTIDCSKTIWLIATNAVDDEIQDFYKSHVKVLSSDEEQPELPKLMKQLSKIIRTVCMDKFGPPITGRISAFMPFLPFTSGEQSVGAHKILLEFAKELRLPIRLNEGGEGEQLLGNIRLKFRRDAAISAFIARDGYESKLGLRSLIAAAEEHCVGPVLDCFLAEDDEIQEGQPMDNYVLDLRNGELVVTRMKRDQHVINKAEVEEF